MKWNTYYGFIIHNVEFVIQFILTIYYIPISLILIIYYLLFFNVKWLQALNTLMLQLNTSRIKPYYM